MNIFVHKLHETKVLIMMPSISDRSVVGCFAVASKSVGGSEVPISTAGHFDLNRVHSILIEIWAVVRKAFCAVVYRQPIERGVG